METDSYTLPRVQGWGKGRERIQGIHSSGWAKPKQRLIPAHPRLQKPITCWPGTCKLSPRMRSHQDPFSATEKSKAVYSSLPML